MTSERRAWAKGGPIAWLRSRIGPLWQFGPLSVTYKPGWNTELNGGGRCTTGEAVDLYVFGRNVARLTANDGSSRTSQLLLPRNRSIVLSSRGRLQPFRVAYSDGGAYDSSVEVNMAMPWETGRPVPDDWPRIASFQMAGHNVIITSKDAIRAYVRRKHGGKPTPYEELWTKFNSRRGN